MAEWLLYVIALESSSLNFQVLLNDVPVKRLLDGSSLTSQTNVNPWIVEGTNALEIGLGLPAGDGQEARADKSRSFQLRLFGGEYGRVPEPEEALIEFIWNSAAQPLGETMTTVFTKEFLPEISFGRWRWQDSPAAPLTESDKQELVQLIREVHRVFKEKDVGGLTELMKLVSEEMARAMDIEEEELVMGQRGIFSNLFASDGWRIDPLEESALVFNPLAGGRLVEVTRPGGQPFLTGTTGESQYASNFMFGRVAGAWQILRPGS